MSVEHKCPDCGEMLTPDASIPCPKCGSLKRSVSVQLTPASAFGGAAPVIPTVISYEVTLLEMARTQIANGQYSVATVVIHMACEIATEQLMTLAYAAKGLSHIENALDRVLGNNIAQDRLRSMFNALTGKLVHEQTFWSRFKLSAERRNKSVHRGYFPTKVEAEDSLLVASELLAYMK